MTPAAAGWRVDDQPEPPCPGSGQLAAPWAGPRPACPACARRLSPDPYAGTLPEHYPDADGARPLDLWSTPADIPPGLTAADMLDLERSDR